MLVPHWNVPSRAILPAAALLVALMIALAAAVLLADAPAAPLRAADRPVFARRMDTLPPIVVSVPPREPRPAAAGGR